MYGQIPAGSRPVSRTMGMTDGRRRWTSASIAAYTVHFHRDVGRYCVPIQILLTHSAGLDPVFPPFLNLHQVWQVREDPLVASYSPPTIRKLRRQNAVIVASTEYESQVIPIDNGSYFSNWANTGGLVPFWESPPISPQFACLLCAIHIHYSRILNVGPF